MTRSGRNRGYSLVEVLVAVSIMAMLVVAMSDVSLVSLAARDDANRRNAVSRELQFAMQRLVDAAAHAPRLVVPLAEDSRTGHLEARIEPGVLVLAIDPSVDLDGDGFADSDNDKDGRVDEDWPADANFDGAPGVLLVDDNNDGDTDVSFLGSGDDDETDFFGGSGEDDIDGIDNDGDGTIDEDPGADMTGDGQAGVRHVDDDLDGSIDEGSRDDDDEDGLVDEDWLDVVVYFLDGSTLRERRPALGAPDGATVILRTVAENVQLFRVERLERGARRSDLLELTLAIDSPDGPVELQTRVRVGGRL